MEQLRAFIAIELPEELKAELARIQSQLKTDRQPSVKWVDPYGIHLTLKFLGSIAVAKIDEIMKALQAAAQEVLPFYLEVKDLDAFPNLNRVQVIWVVIEGEIAQLTRLQQRLESNLTPLGFVPESRPFKPHLTLARLREQASLEERQSLGRLIASTRVDTACRFRVNSVNFMKSELTRAGAIYSRIGLVELKEP